MSDHIVTKEEFVDFKNHLYKKIDLLTSQIQTLLDPKVGIFISTQKNHDAIKRAHERIDEQSEEIDKIDRQLNGYNETPGALEEIRRLKEHRETAIKIAKWVSIGIGGPILASIGTVIWRMLSG